MTTVKYIVTAIYIVICIALIIIATIQTKDSNGPSEAIMGGSSSGNFYEKNKGRTKEGKIKRTTVVLGIVFIVSTIALGILYVM